jgi:hypothetical protein
MAEVPWCRIPLTLALLYRENALTGNKMDSAVYYSSYCKRFVA